MEEGAVTGGTCNGSRACILRRQKKGGFRATMFVYGLVGLENMGFVANMASMVIYFLYKMYFDLSTAANTLTNFMGSTFLLSLLGAFISDAYLNRLHTTLIFGFLECVGLAMLTIQARYKRLLPEYCGESSCVEGGVALMLYASLGLYAVGSGGVKGALAPHGADQFDQKNPKEARALATYFNWLLLSTVLGASIGVTFIVWVSMNKGWYWGFFISLLGALAGYILLAVGTPFYHIQVPSGSPLTKIVQVIVVSFKNRKLTLPEDSSELYEMEISERNSNPTYFKVLHTDQFRWMDKAAIVQNTEKTRDPWKLCTVSEIEEVKVLTRMLPIIGSTIIMNTCLAQLQTFSMEQGSRMNLYLGSWAIPAPTIPIIPLLFLLILIPLYDCYFVPFARKFTGHPTGITQLQRVGVGLVLSAISMCAAGFVEVKRRNAANSFPPFKISLFWLSFQFGIFGIADMFTLVGLLEFFYREAPAGMRSLSTSFTWISLSFGYFLSSLFVSLINTVTGKFDKQGWLHGQDLNKNKLNLFYWFLSVLSVLNFFNYLYWATWYKYKEIDMGGEKFIAADDHKSFEAPVGLKPEGEKDAAKVEEEVTGKNDKEKEQEH